ncbi:MAG TPA: GIY-YIG nuclease family protein [Candidatus Wallbacteria bacterium]|nr:GIY-YIG nuclease family protein [Candidatus Wallbacteria bacterium]
MSKEKKFYVYILECENGNYYTGYTDDIAKRFNAHITGAKTGAKFTRSFKPSRIAAAWEITGGKGAAMKVEHFIKKKRRAIKQNFISDPKTLKDEFFKKQKIVLEIDIIACLQAENIDLKTVALKE